MILHSACSRSAKTSSSAFQVVHRPRRVEPAPIFASPSPAQRRPRFRLVEKIEDTVHLIRIQTTYKNGQRPLSKRKFAFHPASVPLSVLYRGRQTFISGGMAVLLSFVLLILSSVAMRGRAQYMSHLFTIDPTCDQYNMDQYLTDALEMLASARTGISTLQSTRMFLPGSNSRRYMRDV